MKDEHVVHFREWVHRNQKTGVNGFGQDRHVHSDEAGLPSEREGQPPRKDCLYVPPSLLKEYWDKNPVRQVLDSCSLHANADQITKRFLRVFSTLVYIGQPENVTLFTLKNRDDYQLPILELPREFPPALQEFWEQQWMFCPLEFSRDLVYKRELHSRHILPVTYRESLRDNAYGGDGPSIRKVEIHPKCNSILDEPDKDTPMVFKVFKGQEMRNLYRAEADVYSRLSDKNKAHKHIARHYGSFSFEETDTRIIILEYAPQGSLLDFFKNTPLPVTPSDFEMLWKALLKLLTGLYAIHYLDRPPIEGESPNGFTAAVHEDIQPANILVFPHPERSERSTPQEDSRFDVRFKLADFGLAEVRRVFKPGGHFKIENEGNAMCSAPESYANYTFQSEVRPTITTGVDVWALGAVYSDALVWSISGEPGREAYRTARKEAIAHLKHFKAGGHEACFHDGKRRLDAIREFHNKILKDKRESDCISPQMSHFILTDMLRVSDSRVSTDTLRWRADEMIEELPHKAADSSFHSSQSLLTSDRGQMSRVGEDTTGHRNGQTSPSRPRTPQKLPPVPGDRTADQNATPKPVPVNIMYERLKKRSRLSLGRTWDMLQGKHSELPGMESIRSHIRTLDGRDQIFLIDNFISMKPHLEQVARTARVIGYVTKVADNDGMDLFFASDSTRPRKCSTSTAVESAIRKMEFFESRCNMASCLQNLTKAVIKDGKSSIKPTSIYVYTDAMWENENGVKAIITHSISRLVKAGDLPSTLMFQFIQFGNDKIGAERLRKLDDECKETHNLVEYDIVDTKRWDDEVGAIVIGSLSEENDNKKSIVPKGQSDGTG